jgi:hypothetical protein
VINPCPPKRGNSTLEFSDASRGGAPSDPRAPPAVSDQRRTAIPRRTRRGCAQQPLGVGARAAPWNRMG